jgi:hypothetical protein
MSKSGKKPSEPTNIGAVLEVSIGLPFFDVGVCQTFLIKKY